MEYKQINTLVRLTK